MSDKIREKQIKLINELHDIISELKWVMGLPKEASTAGLIIGSMEYVINKCDIVYGKDKYEIVGHPSLLGLSEPKEDLATSDNVKDFDLIEMTEAEFAEFLETGELPENVRTVGGPKPTIYH